MEEEWGDIDCQVGTIKDWRKGEECAVRRSRQVRSDHLIDWEKKGGD